MRVLLEFDSKILENSTEGASVLIVDDIPKNLQLLAKLLDEEGYNIAAVNKGTQVILSAKKFRPDLILLDVMMPDKNGFEVCRELKKEPDLKSIPVVFLTGKAEQKDIVEGLRIGGADYVTKPFNSEELLARVETHVLLKRSKDKILEQNEHLLSLNKTKDKIYSVIGHDLRGPINAITGFSELLLLHFENHSEDDSVIKKLRIIRQSTLNVSRLLNNLLSWARTQTGDLSLLIKEFSVEEVVQKTIDLLSLAATGKGIEIYFDPAPFPEVRGDEQMIATIVRNFLSNAIKFCNAGDRIELILQQDSGSWSISVKDEGAGMPEEIRQKLFNADMHPSTTGTAHEKGTGLGLMLCKKLAEMHGGSILVESRPGEGSVFTLRVPFEIEEPVN